MISYNKLCEKYNHILYTTILFTLYSAPPLPSARSAHVRLCPAPSRPPQAPHRACALPRAPRLQNPAWTFSLCYHGQCIFYTPADGLSKYRSCQLSLCRDAAAGKNIKPLYTEDPTMFYSCILAEFLSFLSVYMLVPSAWASCPASALSCSASLFRLSWS